MQLVLWSGGLDSTAIILHYLKKNIPFETVYMNLENNSDKVREEKRTRKKIMKALEHHYKVKITDYEIKLATPNFKYDKPLAAQPLLWMFGIMQSIHGKYDNVNLGYLREDCFWHIKHNFEEAYWHLKRVLDNNFEKLPLLHYPLEWHTKNGVIDQYYSDEIGKYIFPMIWVCEHVTEPSIQCGKCAPCERFKDVKKYFKRKKR